MTESGRAAPAQAGTPAATPAAAPVAAPVEQGFRWPAEWEPHAATWLSWPHNPETWPTQLERAEAAFAAMVEALVPHERVRINVADDAMEERARKCIAERGTDADRGIEFFHTPTDDAWVRDHGPVFVVRGSERAILDFGFDAWGKKYPPWTRDNTVPRHTAKALGLQRFEPGFVLEAGSVDGDGAGTILTTASCLLNPNREVGRTRDQMEARLAATLGARCVIWLADGIAGDDTDGHVDDFARFIARGRVVVAVEEDTSDANWAPLRAARDSLRAARDADGKPLEVIELPMPAALRCAGDRLPASHANFYLANEVVLMPSFGGASDAVAAAILAECCEGRVVIPIPCSDLVVGLGGVHCLTQQEPAPSA